MEDTTGEVIVVSKMELNASLLKQLECPVCLETCAPPIRMCVRTHVICSKCCEGVTDCATCREPMSAERCWFAEQVYAHLMLPCRNNQDGCDVILNVLDLEGHVDNCEYKPYACMFPESSAVIDGRWNRCSWTGQLTELSQHVQTAHPEGTCDEDNNVQGTILLIDLLLPDDVSTVLDTKLVAAFGCHLWFVVVRHQPTQELEFLTLFVGPKEVSSNMSYKIVVGSKDTRCLIVRKSVVPVSMEEAKLHSCKLKYHILGPSLEDDDTLHYKMSVIFGKLTDGFQITSKHIKKQSESPNDVAKRLSFVAP